MSEHSAAATVGTGATHHDGELAAVLTERVDTIVGSVWPEAWSSWRSAESRRRLVDAVVATVTDTRRIAIQLSVDLSTVQPALVPDRVAAVRRLCAALDSVRNSVISEASSDGATAPLVAGPMQALFDAALAVADQHGVLDEVQDALQSRRNQPRRVCLTDSCWGRS